MEFLLFVQPIGETLLPFIIMAISIGTIGVLAFYLTAMIFYHKKTYENPHSCYVPYTKDEIAKKRLDSAVLRAIGKKFFVLLLASSIALLPVVTAAQGWEIFKNMVIYKVATSDTADKAIDNTNLLMDKLNEFIDGWDPKAKVEKVEEVIEKVTE